MSKHRRREYIKGASLRRQRAARRTAAIDKTRTRAVARTIEDPVLTETSGEVFASGAMIELVRNSDADQLKLAYWNGSSISICTRVDLDGRTFVPPALHDSVLEIINLPSNATDYGSTPALVDDLRRFFRAHPGLSEEAVSKAAFGALATWFPECAPPLLIVSAPDPSGSRLLLEQLRYVCRRSMIIGDVTRGGIWSLPLSLRPTIIIDRPKPTKDLPYVLRAMSRPGVHIPQKGHLLDVSCPIVICMQELISDSWLLEQGVQIEAMASVARFPRIARQALREVSLDLQAKLLSYRLRNLAKVQCSNFDAPQLAFPTREIARALGDCIIDASELQSRVVPLLEEQDEDARVRRTSTFEAVIVEAALVFCHEKKKREWAYVGEFATVANAILEGRGEQIELEPRAVGDVLRSVGLFTRRLGRAGRGVLLVSEVRQKIHELAWGFCVRSIDDGVDRCKFCSEARTRFGDSIRAGM
jgi:hypothetical protein